jgi:hypothetical protein
MGPANDEEAAHHDDRGQGDAQELEEPSYIGEGKIPARGHHGHDQFGEEF